MDLDSRPLSGGPGPQVHLEVLSVRAGTSTGHWLVSWLVRNQGSGPVRLLTSWLPHGRFRGQQRQLSPAPLLLPARTTRLELPVLCSEPPGTVVENAFLILRVGWEEREWRVLARLRVEVDEKGTPWPVTETITAHPVGFSHGRVS